MSRTRSDLPRRGAGGGRGRRPPTAALPCLLLAAAVAACGAAAEEQAAGTAALSFAFRATTDPAVACADLAPRTAEELERSAVEPCPEALSDEGLPGSTTISQAVVAGNSAVVHLADPAQTVFLARFDSGWKIVAAGCRKDSDDDAAPYTCRITGG